MRQNPHVRICGGPGSATTLVYPTSSVGEQLGGASARTGPRGPLRPCAAVSRAAPTTRSRGTSPPHRPPSSRHRCRGAPALREALRHVSDPGLVRDDHRPAPPQSRRPPTLQRRPLSSRHRPHAVPSANPRLRRPPHGGRPNQARDHPVPETCPRSRDLPARHDRFPRSPKDHPGRLNECLDI